MATCPYCGKEFKGKLSRGHLSQIHGKGGPELRQDFPDYPEQDIDGIRKPQSRPTTDTDIFFIDKQADKRHARPNYWKKRIKW